MREDIGQNGLGDIKPTEQGSRETALLSVPRAPRHKPKPGPECARSALGAGPRHRQPQPRALPERADALVMTNGATLRRRLRLHCGPTGRSPTASALLPPGLGGPALR